jgi:predicted porin
MKQRLLFTCLAAAGLTAATGAMADAEVYGRLHGDWENTKTGSSSAVSTNMVQNDTSRIGFRGNEDLGNGVKAIWQVESGVAIDDGSAGTSTGSLGTRETFLGLSSSRFGTFKLGNFLVAIDDLHGIAGNVFQYTTGISNDAALWLNGGKLSTGGFDARVGNSVSYETPNINGFTSRVQYSLTTGTGSSESQHGGASVISGNVQYNKGPLRVGYGIQANRDMQTMSSGFYQHGLTNMLAVGYTVGPFYLAGLVEHDTLKNINGTGKDRSRNYGSVLASYTTGNNVFSVFGGKAGAWHGDAGVADSGAKMGTVAYNYVLSKSTQVYVLYTTLRDDSNATYVLGGNPTTGTPQASNQHSLAIGMWKNF